MILLFAVVLGLILGLGRAKVGGIRYQPPILTHVWMVVLMMLPQVLAFYFEPTARLISDRLAATCLITSQIGLLIFVALNIKHPGIWLLGIGLGLNLLVIVTNGGLMPLSPEIASHLISGRAQESWVIGTRFGLSKDVILPPALTTFWLLSDRFLLPIWLPWRVAFSSGDVMIGLGALWLLWSGGARVKGSSKIRLVPELVQGE